MDLSLIGAANSAIVAAREIGKAAIGLRDFNQLSAVVAQLNDQILKAQDSLFAHNTQLMALQQEVIEAREKLRKMEETVAQRRRYTLFELSDGVFVYRVNISPEGGAASDPCSAEPIHYVCQPCLDTKDVRVVLVRSGTQLCITHICPQCKAEFLELQKPSNYSRSRSGTPMAS